jgi:hypothetical protein
MARLMGGIFVYLMVFLPIIIVVRVYGDGEPGELVSGSLGSILVASSKSVIEKKRRPPDWLLVGASKSGTSAFAQVATLHPEIGVMTIKPPFYEPHFFNGKASFHSTRDLGKKWYEGRLGALNKTFVGEKTPDYMCDPVVPGRIKNLYPKTQIIMFLREPGSQAYSHYNMVKSHKWIHAGNEKYLYANTTGSFSPCRFLNRGLYMKHINRFLNFFHREQIHVFIYEELLRRRKLLGVEREYEFVFEAIGTQFRQLKISGEAKGRLGFYHGYKVPFRDASLKEWRCSVYNSVHRHTNELLYQWLGRRITSWDMPDCDNDNGIYEQEPASM